MPRGNHITDYEPVRRSPQRDTPTDEIADEGWALRRGSSTNNSRASADVKPLPRTPQTVPTSHTAKKENLIVRRGHAISYAGLFLFTTVLYFRPYELFTQLSSLTSIAYWLAIFTLLAFIPSHLVLEGTFMTRLREVDLVLLLCLTALLSIPLAINPGESWDTFVEFFKAVCMFIVMVNVVRTERRLRGLFFLAITVGCVLSVSAINNYRLGNFAIRGERIAGLVGGMFDNPNHIAIHLVIVVPIAIALSLTARGLHSKILYGACALLMIAGIVVTFSRGGFFGFVCAGAVLAWKVGRRYRLTVFGLVTVCAVALIALAPGGYADRLSTIGDASAVSRKALLFRSLKVAIYNPVFGVGMGNFHIVSIGELVSHNAYTQAAAEMGLAAAVIYTLFIVLPLKQLGQIERETFTARRGSTFYYLAVGLQASIAGYMVSSFFASVAYQWYVYYLIGYAVCLRRLYQSDSKLTESKSTEAEDQRTLGGTKNRRHSSLFPREPRHV